MLSPSKRFRIVVLLGDQHARHSVSPVRFRTTRSHHKFAVAAPSSPGLLSPLYGGGYALVSALSGGATGVLGCRCLRASVVPLARDSATSRVRHAASLRRPAT